MKRHLLIFISFIFIIFLSSCDTSNMVFENHEYEHTYDEHYHYDKCSCGDIKNKEEHIFSDAIHVITYPTCTTEGINEYHCIACDYKEKRTVPALGHKYGSWEVIQEPTCISKGQSKRVCEICGDEEFKELDIISHKPHNYDDLDSDCTHEGHIGGTYCEVCNIELTPSTKVDKKDHSYGEWETTVEPTCITKGQARRICSICNHEEYIELDMIDHKPISYNDEASTCITHGHAGGSYCEFCKKELEAPTELPLGNHKYDIITTTKEATLNEEGIKTYTCSICGDSYTESIPRATLSSNIFSKSLDSSKFNNSYIEFTYMDNINNIYQDIIFMNKDNLSYIKVYDHNLGKEYNYYNYLNTEVIETWLDDYRHKKYDKNEDIYLKYQNILLDAVKYSSTVPSSMTYDTEHSYYKLINEEVYNYKNEKELAYLGIKIDDDGNIKEFAYSSDKYFINLQSITKSISFNAPQHKYHHVINNKCEICDKEYITYNVSKDDFDLYYSINNQNEIEFDYKLLNGRTDITFLAPTYYKDDKLERFNSLYYEGKTPIMDNIKSYTLNDGVLKITYKDNSIKRYLLFNDYSMVEISSDTASDSSKYSGNVSNKTFKIEIDNKIYHYIFNSSSELKVEEYNQIYYYRIQDYNIVDYTNSNLESKFDVLVAYSNARRHNGETGNVTYQLNSDMTLDIYYGGIHDDFRAFKSIKVLNIKGSSKDYYIYFMGDNEKYLIHYENIKISIYKTI